MEFTKELLDKTIKEIFNDKGGESMILENNYCEIDVFAHSDTVAELIINDFYLISDMTKTLREVLAEHKADFIKSIKIIHSMLGQ